MSENKYLTRYLTRREVAALYPVSADFLARVAQKGDKRLPGLPPAPPSAVICGRVVYERSSFEAWLDGLIFGQNDNQSKRRGRGRPKKVEPGTV